MCCPVCCKPMIAVVVAVVVCSLCVHAEPLDGGHELLEKYAHPGADHMSLAEFDQMYQNVFNLSSHDDDHGHRRSLKRRRLEEHEEEGASNATCLLVSDVLRESNVDATLPIEKDGVIRSAAVMLVMSWRGCADFFRNRDSPACGSRQSSPAEAWGYGFLSVIIISLLSLSGVAIIPITKKDSSGKKVLLEVLVSFAVGTLTGDVIFHILPGLTGVHAHSPSAVDPIYYLAVVSLSVWFFFIIERVILQLAHVSSHEESADHGVFASARAHILSHETQCEDEEHHEDLHQNKKAAGYLNLIADAFHNFTDGLALGAAWSSSVSLGLGTSIAVMFHEIPQELGDFAILLSSGFSKKQALLLNLLSASVSIVGLIIGVAIGTNSTLANGWILSFTAGGFLYIAIAEMVPELLKQRGKNHTAIQLAGILLGMGAMLVLAVYEEDLAAAICLA